MLNNDHQPTGFTYDLSLVPDYPGYEWLPESDESGRTIYKPHLIEQAQVVEQVATTREQVFGLPPISFEGFKR